MMYACSTMRVSAPINITPGIPTNQANGRAMSGLATSRASSPDMPVPDMPDAFTEVPNHRKNHFLGPEIPN